MHTEHLYAQRANPLRLLCTLSLGLLTLLLSACSESMVEGNIYLSKKGERLEFSEAQTFSVTDKGRTSPSAQGTYELEGEQLKLMIEQFGSIRTSLGTVSEDSVTLVLGSKTVKYVLSTSEAGMALAREQAEAEALAKQIREQVCPDYLKLGPYDVNNLKIGMCRRDARKLLRERGQVLEAANGDLSVMKLSRTGQPIYQQRIRFDASGYVDHIELEQSAPQSNNPTRRYPRNTGTNVEVPGGSVTTWNVDTPSGPAFFKYQRQGRMLQLIATVRPDQIERLR